MISESSEEPEYDFVEIVGEHIDIEFENRNGSKGMFKK